MYLYIIVGSLLYIIFLFNLPLFHNNNIKMTHLGAMRVIFLIPVIGFLFFLTVFRSINVGTDYSMYYNYYVNDTYAEHFDFLIIFIYEAARQEGNFLLFTTIITGLFIMFNLLAIKKLSYNFFVSFTFFVLSFYFFYIFNGMRQAVAISIIFFGIYYIQKEQLKLRDILLYTLVIILARQFHFSAIFMFPLIFLRYIKINKTIVFFAFTVTLIGYFSSYPKEVVASLLMNFDFYAQKYAYATDSFFGVNKEKGLIEFIPVLIQYFFLYYIFTLNHFKSVYEKFVINYYLCFLILYIGSGIEAIDRIQFYFYPSIILFYDYLINELYRKRKIKTSRSFINMRKTMAFVSISFWFLYFVLRIVQGTQGITPYNFIS